MGSYLDARAHWGQWWVRIEDIDTPRVVHGADTVILRQLAALGMHWDAPPVWQSQRLKLYESAFEQLKAGQQVYPCGCTRQELGGGPYQGTCRHGLPPGRNARAWRFRVPEGTEHFTDRRHGPLTQNVASEVGDFIIRRADGLWAYQLVVVVDDHDQGITHIVRGDDLLDSTARQRVLARHLGMTPPATLHVPLVMDTDGRKLSKQNHAQALDTANPLPTLHKAWQGLGFAAFSATTVESFWSHATAIWAQRFPI